MREKPRRRTYRHLVESIRTSLDREGYPSDDTRFSAYAIFDKLLTTRAKLIREYLRARIPVGRQNLQTIPCIPLMEADKNVCPCQPPSGCTWLKSKKTIPKSIRLSSVANTNAQFSAEYVEWTQFKNKINSRSFRKEDRYYTFLDTGDGSFLYLYNEDFLKNVSLTGLFEDPNESATHQGCEEDKNKEKHYLLCNPLDTPTYIDSALEDSVLEAALAYFAQTTGASQSDTANDDTDNAGGVQNNTV